MFLAGGYIYKMLGEVTGLTPIEGGIIMNRPPIISQSDRWDSYNDLVDQQVSDMRWVRDWLVEQAKMNTGIDQTVGYMMENLIDQFDQVVKEVHL